MSEIANTTRLWVVNRHSTFLVLAQGLTGTPNAVEPAPILYKASYLQRTDGTDHLDQRKGDLDSGTVMLMARLQSPDGPPALVTFVFGLLPLRRVFPIGWARRRVWTDCTIAFLERTIRAIQCATHNRVPVQVTVDSLLPHGWEPQPCGDQTHRAHRNKNMFAISERSAWIQVRNCGSDHLRHLIVGV